MSERTGTVARHILNLSDLKRYEEMFKFAIKLENELSAATQQLNEQAAVIEMLREAANRFAGTQSWKFAATKLECMAAERENGTGREG